MEKGSGRCFLCGKDLEVYLLRDFGAKVCENCIPEFVLRRTLATIRSFKMLKPKDKLAVGVSGGKDSIALISVLSKLQKKLDIQLVPFHLHLGFGDFSDAALEKARKACQKSGLELKVYYLSDFGVHIEPIGSFPACAVCGALKRNIFNRIARQEGCGVIATAHTFDDIFLFALKNLVAKKDNIPAGVMLSLNPLVPRKIKPFYRIPEYLTELYCQVSELDFLKGECPVSDGKGHSLKGVLAEIDRASPSFRRQILDNLKRIYKKAGKKPKDLIFECVKCGEPSSQQLCPVCRVQEVQKKGGFQV